MKASRVFLVILITAAAFTAAVNIFSDSKKEVELFSITQIEYADSIVLSGTVCDLSALSEEADNSLQALSPNGIYITAYVGENNISKLSVGQSAVISGSGFADKTYNATVVKIGDTAKKISLDGIKIAAVEVILSVNNPDGLIKSGFSADARIFLEDKSDVRIAPYSSVIVKNGEEYVYIYDEGTATLTPVQTGRELSGGYEILSGVESGDKIVLNPHNLGEQICKVTVLSGAGE